MSIFEAYDTEFGSLASNIETEMTSLRSLKGPDALNKERMVAALLGQSQDLLKQMEVEVRSQDGPVRKKLGEKVTQYRKALAVHKAELATVASKNAKASLLGGGNGESNGDRSHLLGVGDKLYRQNDAILNAQRTVFETEAVGADIVEELGRNRDKITSAQDRVRDFSGVADGARRLVSSMQRRDMQHRFLMYALFASLLVALCAGVYYVMVSD